MDDDILYEVEQIKDARFNKDRNRLEYHIKWKNYDEWYENTWEPEENLACPILLKQFWDGSNKQEFMRRAEADARKNESDDASSSKKQMQRPVQRKPVPPTQQKPKQHKSPRQPSPAHTTSTSSSSGMGTQRPARLEFTSEARKRLREEVDQRLRQKNAALQSVHKPSSSRNTSRLLLHNSKSRTALNNNSNATHPRLVPQRKENSYLRVKRSAQPHRPASYGIDELIARVNENAMDRRSLPSSRN